MESEIIIAIKNFSILALCFHMVTDGHPHRLWDTSKKRVSSICLIRKLPGVDHEIT